LDAVDAALSKVDPSRVKEFRDAYAKATVNLDVDVESNGEENVNAAVARLRGVLSAIDVLTDEERDAILAQIGADLNPIKSALTAAGLDDGQAEAVQGAIDGAVGTLREKLIAMNIVDEETLAKITELVSQDRAQIKGSLLALGLTPEQVRRLRAV
jgi:DNA-binding FrmR family transcriptional regulator